MTLTPNVLSSPRTKSSSSPGCSSSLWFHLNAVCPPQLLLKLPLHLPSPSLIFLTSFPCLRDTHTVKQDVLALPCSPTAFHVKFLHLIFQAVQFSKIPDEVLLWVWMLLEWDALCTALPASAGRSPPYPVFPPHAALLWLFSFFIFPKPLYLLLLSCMCTV